MGELLDEDKDDVLRNTPFFIKLLHKEGLNRFHL